MAKYTSTIILSIISILLLCISELIKGTFILSEILIAILLFIGFMWLITEGIDKLIDTQIPSYAKNLSQKPKVSREGGKDE